MKALQLIGPGNIKIIDDIRVPNCNAESVILKVKYCAICSSDIKFIDKGHRIDNYPITLGHEISGEVFEVGKKVRKFKVGDKLALGAEIPCGNCRFCKNNNDHLCENQLSVGTKIDGGFSEYILLNKRFIANGPIVKLDKLADMKLSSLSESIACVINGIEITNRNKFDSVLILGAGYMGIIFGIVLKKKYNVKNIIISDINPKRLQYINKLGFKNTVQVDFEDKNSIKKILRKNKNNKFDFVISANNQISSHRVTTNLVDKGGIINLFGGIPKNIKDTLLLPTNKMHYDQYSITGSFSSNLKQLKAAVKFISKNR